MQKASYLVWRMLWNSLGEVSLYSILSRLTSEIELEFIICSPDYKEAYA